MLLQPHDERIFFFFFTNSLLSVAGKGLKNGHVLTPPLSSSTPFLDIMVKNDTNRISNKLDQF